MESVLKMSTRLSSLLIALVLMTFLIGAAQIADAPPLEAINPDDISYYWIADDGRIVDSDGRLRGWIKGDAIYSPELELMYHVSGRSLEDVP